MLAIAHFPSARRFACYVRINMTRKSIRRKLLADERSPGWGRNALGYLADPETVYEIRTLKTIMGMLQNCDKFQLTYNIKDNKRGDQVKGSIQQTVEGILVVCAAAEVNIKGVELCDHHNGSSTVTVDKSPPIQPWDKTLPLLDAACALIPALQLTIDPKNDETDWVASFLPKCVNLEQPSVNYTASPRFISGLHHRFYDDIVAMTEPLPKVQALMIETNGFTLDQLTAYVGRFKESIRELRLARVRVHDQNGWLKFFEWAKENLPLLEKFDFTALTYNSRRTVLCYDSVLNDKELTIELPPGRRWETLVRLDGGTLKLDHSNALIPRDTWDQIKEIADGTFDWDKYRRKNGPTSVVSYQGSTAGAREALQLLALAAAPLVVKSLSSRSNTIKV